jgi:hypothetical protein
MAQETLNKTLAGSCACGQVRYSLLAQPLFVHCCHCHRCQRETGTAFALNALIESSNVNLHEGEVESIRIPSDSGAGQTIVRCKHCAIALWSHYGLAQGEISFVRVGTLDDAASFAPDIHIFTASKQPWVNLEGSIPVVEEYYRRSEHWPEESIKRYRILTGETL